MKKTFSFKENDKTILCITVSCKDILVKQALFDLSTMTFHPHVVGGVLRNEITSFPKKEDEETQH